MSGFKIRVPSEDEVLEFRKKYVAKYADLDIASFSSPLLTPPMSDEYITLRSEEDVKGMVYSVVTKKTNPIATRDYKEAVEVFFMMIDEVGQPKFNLRG